MQTDTIYIYTDASFSKDHELAITGYAMVSGTYEHQNMAAGDLVIKTLKIKEDNNIRAEVRGAITALKACPKSARVILYTDCKNIVDLPGRRLELEKSDFIGKTKHKKLVNADLYKEFYAILDIVKPELRWVKGHTSSKDLNQTQENFSSVDQEVRKSLRKAIADI